VTPTAGGDRARPAGASGRGGPARAAASPAEVLERPIGRSGLAAAATLRRAGLRLGWERVRDLLFHLPRRYDDLREMRTIVEFGWVEEGTVVSARVRVADVRIEPGVRRRVQRTIARLEDDTGTIEATWFGRRYIERRLHPGDRVVVSGRVKHFGRRLTLDNPDFQHDGAGEMLHVGRIVPVYRLTAGLTAARLRTAMRSALDLIRPGYPEYLPRSVRAAADLPDIGAALEAAHYPTSFEERDAALRRLAFDELLALQLGMVGRRRARGRARAQRVEIPDPDVTALRSAIERALSDRLGRAVALTADQQHAIDEIRSDLARDVPMLRLLQGDVGSGKTAVAAWALAAVARQGRQGALLAPTDLLARQHAKTVGDLVGDLGVAVELVTGSLPADRRRAAVEAVQSGMAGIVVGTHALLEESLAFHDLALAVVDEQHRFGVEQRGALEAKSREGSPHVLLMTATPIPRTIGQVVYADLDLSTLHTPPEGRLTVRTGIRHPDELDRLWSFVDAEAEAGRATFVVVPAIEESEGSDVVAAEAEAVRLRTLMPNRRIGLVHGRMKAQDRDAELALLRDGDLDVLVGTTVLEVGVDVPRASVMVVESAELFGLAQLHQLRGRVGRGTQQSYAALVSSAASSQAWAQMVAGRRSPETTEQARLLAVVASTDGFELAERDFELRREGDVLGLAQSGLPRLRVATLASAEHRELAVRARDVASNLLDDRGALRPELEALEEELRRGWLARVFAGDPADAATAA